MPVLSDENNKVIGIITISDLVKLYGTEVDKIMKLRNRSNVNIDLSDNEINNNKEKHHTQDKSTK
jgi:CBS domain-containing protein